MKPPQRILLVHFGDHFGGVEVYIERLATLLRNHAKVYGMCSHPEMIQRLKAIDVPVVLFPQFIASRKITRAVLSPVLLAFAIFRLNLDIVQVNGPADSILLAVARLFGRSAYSTMHQTLDLETPSLYQSVSRTIYLQMVRFANVVVCVSATVSRQLISVRPKSPVLVIPNWAAPIPPIKPKPRVPGYLNMIFVGRLEKHKGLHVLIDAMRGIPNVVLTVVGEGSCRRELEDYAEKSPVHFVGFSNTPANYFGQADLLVLPSFGPEGLPLVCLEAMAHSLPCLLSDIEVHRELSENGKLAALFPSGNVSALREKLLQLLEDVNILGNYAREAHTTLSLKYSEAAATKAYLQAFRLATEV